MLCLCRGAGHNMFCQEERTGVFCSEFCGFVTFLKQRLQSTVYTCGVYASNYTGDAALIPEYREIINICVRFHRFLYSHWHVPETRKTRQHNTISSIGFVCEALW